jgi:hypothetical protein
MMSKVGPKEILMQKQIIRFFQKELDYSTFLPATKILLKKIEKVLTGQTVCFIIYRHEPGGPAGRARSSRG